MIPRLASFGLPSLGHRVAAALAAVGLAAGVATPAVAVPEVPATGSVAGEARSGEVLDWTGMGPHVAPTDNVVASMAAQAKYTNPSPINTNVECTPAPGENPVIFIHGMSANFYQTYASFAPYIAAQGKCVYGMNYGAFNGAEGTEGSSLAGSIPGADALAPLDSSLAEVTEQIERVKKNTGATEVDLVGYSEGGTLAAAYTKNVGGKGVGTVVTLAGVLRGTSMLGLSTVVNGLNNAGSSVDSVIDKVVGPGARDLLEHSEFMVGLREGGIEVPGVRYVAISTLFDEAATPLSHSQFSGGDHRNIVLQEGCVQDRSDHLGITFSPRAYALTANALGRNVEVPCTAMAGPLPVGASAVGSTQLSS
ncbi:MULTISPECIES: triacylglycerol lipase [unclassified Corynebacterium]|uniref:esterase/lipase family protein n=1 Tax=unclassified Corynebacterium TaxID=2624378 RepID=UPI001D0E56C2|nr:MULTISPECIES: alpha/beta fold hydrolase [unclassified Corynebacterium]